MKLIEAGKISSVHGVKGQVKVNSYLENIKDLENYKIYDKDNNIVEIKISFIKRFMNKIDI